MLIRLVVFMQMPGHFIEWKNRNRNGIELERMYSKLRLGGLGCIEYPEKDKEDKERITLLAGRSCEHNRRGVATGN